MSNGLSILIENGAWTPVNLDVEATRELVAIKFVLVVANQFGNVSFIVSNISGSTLIFQTSRCDESVI